jgi:hypothetical protein
MKKSELKTLIKECLLEVIKKKPSYGTQLDMAHRKAKKEKNVEAIAYYELLGDTSASVPFESFKGSWAYGEWLKKPTTIEKIKKIQADIKRWSWMNESPLKENNRNHYTDKKTGKKIQVKYYPEVETEVGNKKIYHTFVDEQGNEVTAADFTPYARMSSEDIKNWFALGCPNRNVFKMQSPLNSEVLKKAVSSK